LAAAILAREVLAFVLVGWAFIAKGLSPVLRAEGLLVFFTSIGLALDARFGDGLWLGLLLVFEDTESLLLSVLTVAYLEKLFLVLLLSGTRSFFSSESSSESDA